MTDMNDAHIAAIGLYRQAQFIQEAATRKDNLLLYGETYNA